MRSVDSGNVTQDYPGSAIFDDWTVFNNRMWHSISLSREAKSPRHRGYINQWQRPVRTFPLPVLHLRQNVRHADLHPVMICERSFWFLRLACLRERCEECYNENQQHHTAR